LKKEKPKKVSSHTPKKISLGLQHPQLINKKKTHNIIIIYDQKNQGKSKTVAGFVCAAH
jgi:hypothetical protein